MAPRRINGFLTEISDREPLASGRLRLVVAAERFARRSESTRNDREQSNGVERMGTEVRAQSSAEAFSRESSTTIL
jgi:hypothetical protein